MAPINTDLKKQCMQVLLGTGASKETCEFYADAAQYESDMTRAICRIRKELIRLAEDHCDASAVSSTLQSMLMSFISLKKNFENFSTQHEKIPAIRVNSEKLGVEPNLKALCCLQTKQVRMKAGDDYTVVDTTQPNKLKIRTEVGSEGFVPAVSCLLPSPDVSTTALIDRLQIYLLMCWHECDTKAKLCLVQCVYSTVTDMWSQWSTQPWKRTKSDEIIGRQLKRIVKASTSIGDKSSSLDCAWLHQTLIKLENDLSHKTNTELTRMTQLVGELDKAVLFYEAFRRNWRLFRQNIKNTEKPLHLVFNWDPSVFGNKIYKYYEVKLTTEDQTVREETTSQLNSSTSSSKDSQWSTTETTTTNTHETGSGRRDVSELLTHDVSEETVTTGTIEELSTGYQQEVTSSTVSATPELRASVVGGSMRQSVDAEQVVMASHEETKRFYVKTVIDPRDGNELSMDQAVAAGIVDQARGLYINPDTGTSSSITTAIGDGSIVIEHVKTTRTAETTKSVGLITIRTETDTREYTISAAIDTAAGQKIDADEARRRDIVNENDGSYFNTATRRRMTLDEAIDVGLVIAEFETPATGPSPDQCETKMYAINAVVDQLLRRPVPFLEAVRHGLIDRDTGCYINNATGEHVFAGEAIRRGFFKCQLVDNPNSLIGIDAANKVVVDRIDRVRKNILREIKVVAAFKR